MPLLQALFGGAFTLLTAYALGVLAIRRRPVPFEIALGIGAVVQSLLVLALLLFGAAYWWAFLAIGVVAIAAGVRRPGRPVSFPTELAGVAIFAAYGVWYFVNALA